MKKLDTLLKKSIPSLRLEEVDVIEEREVAEELSPAYAEALRALMMCESQGAFPMRGSGNIVFHYNEQGKLVKVVPSRYVKV